MGGVGWSGAVPSLFSCWVWLQSLARDGRYFESKCISRPTSSPRELKRRQKNQEVGGEKKLASFTVNKFSVVQECTCVAYFVGRIGEKLSQCRRGCSISKAGLLQNHRALGLRSETFGMYISRSNCDHDVPVVDRMEKVNRVKE